MFQSRIHLFTLFDFPVRIDPSWFIIFFLVAGTLAIGYFPAVHPELPTAWYWIMGLIGSLGLFVSVVIHEFSHALVARRYGLPMGGITLFLFGGMAEMEQEPPHPKAELLTAIAGPLASLVIVFACFLVVEAGRVMGWFEPVLGIFFYLGLINVILIIFNLLPAFPLDGGRVLRAVLWHFKGNLRWATKVTSTIGSGFGLFLIVLGVLSLLGGALIGGIWWMLIGWFLRNAAKASYQQLLVREELAGHPVAEFMQPEPVQISADWTLQELMDQYAPHHFVKTYPVVDGERLVGCLDLSQIKNVARSEWATRTVRDMLGPCVPDTQVKPETDAMEAMTHMQKKGLSILLVVDGESLKGTLSWEELSRILKFRRQFQDA